MNWKHLIKLLRGEEMMNTRIHYLYRDADNYKVQNECVILGEMTEEQEQRIIACLDEKEYFVPSRVGNAGAKIRYGNGCLLYTSDAADE